MKCIKSYVGIDISKLHFDVAIENEDGHEHYRFTNDITGFNKLIKLVSDNDQVIMEASGPYYLKLACYLHQQAIAVSVVNPLVIRRFCQMRLTRTKTDKKDAKMIAQYGQTEHPPLWTPAPNYLMEIQQLQSASDLLDKNRTALLRQLEALNQNPFISKEAVKAIGTAIKALQKQIAILEARMQLLIKEQHAQMYQQLQTIPGLGKKTTILLIAISNGFKKFTNARQLSSYVGLCPRIFESGTSVKGRAGITKMGMSRVRSMLYLCAWSAKKCNQTCKELYDRLVAKGKSKRLALIAVANKLLKQAFAIATSQTDYQSNYQKNICF